MEYSWPAEGELRILRERPAKRYIVQTSGGYFPVIGRLADGRLGLIARDGDFHVGVRGRLTFATSADGGRSWSHARVVAGEGPDNRNPAFGVLKDGTLLLAYMVQDGYQGGLYHPAAFPFDPQRPRPALFLKRSTDGGESWSDPEPLRVDPAGSWSPYGKIIQLKDGTVLLHAYGRRWLGGEREKADCSLVLRSADGGRTWSAGHVIAANPPEGSTGFNETALLELPSGRVLAAVRMESGDRTKWGANLWVCHSDDGGRTWSPPRQVTHDDEHPADLLLLQDGRILLTYGYRNPPFGVRALLSRDGGATWDDENTIELVAECTNRDCGYPSAAQNPDGSIFVAYYAYESIGPWTSRPGLVDERIGIHCAGVLFSPADLP